MKNKQGKTMSEDLKSAFDNISKQYDDQRKMLIPCFQDLYTIASSLLKTDNPKPEILDIGAGTGLLSEFIMNSYPEGHFLLIDLSAKMLDIAQSRFKDKANIEYIVEDYVKSSFKSKHYDFIVSALSIHHLTQSEKRSLYQKIYDSLKQGGIFVNADQVLGENDYLDRLYKEDWKNKIEQTKLSKIELDAAYERTKLDKMDSLSVQLTQLKECGFSYYDCIYKYFNFVVLYAVK